MTLNIARTIPSRESDPETSHKAYEKIKLTAGKNHHKMLMTYLDGPKSDEEAYWASGTVQKSPWKRCSELLKSGLIREVGTTISSCGTEVRVCEITLRGHLALEQLKRSE